MIRPARSLPAVLAVAVCALLGPVAFASAAAEFNVSALAPASPSLVRDVAVGDLDGRNGPDVVTSYVEGGVSVNLNNGNGTFGAARLFPTGCDTVQVELADLGNTSYSLFPDGLLDAAVVCLYGSGNSQYLGRLAGDGAGGFVAAQIVPELNFGPFNTGYPQEMALANVRGPGLAPLPVFTYTTVDPFHEPYAYRVLCFSYDWATKDCLGRDTPQTSAPLVPGVVADARVFALGGPKGLIDWGPIPAWSWSSRELAPKQPSTTNENFRSITIGDLAGDGPDIINAAGSCGCGFQDVPAAGVVDISYGTAAAGVPDQVGTVFPSAPGVTSIATGDFDLDGRTDLIGTNSFYDPAAKVSTSGVFVQAGNGAGGLAAPQLIPLSSKEGFSRAPIRVADFDGNGGPDAAAIVEGKVQILLNRKAKPIALPIAAKVNPLAGVKGLPKKATLDKHGSLLLGSAANPPTASVALTLTVPAAKKPKSGQPRASAAKPKGKKKKAKKPIVIGTAKIKIPAGKKLPLKLHLNGKGKSLLAKGSLKATLTVVAVGTDGSKATKTQKLKVSPAKKKPKQKSQR